MPSAQQKALLDYRRRCRDDGFVRVEVKVPAADAKILRDLAAILRGNLDTAQALRERLHFAIAQPGAASISDIFGSDLPDSCFDGVFERRDHGPIRGDAEL